MIASAKEIDALNITLFNSCINFTNVHLCNYCTKIFVIVVKTCAAHQSFSRNYTDRSLLHLRLRSGGVQCNQQDKSFRASNISKLKFAANLTGLLSTSSI